MRILLSSGGLTTDPRREAFRTELSDFLGPIEEILFVPYALADHDRYVQNLLDRNYNAGKRLVGIHTFADQRKAVKNAQSIFIGGGNSFRLLSELYQRDLVTLIRERIHSGAPYIGISAGTNCACPAIKNTNDMPITLPPSLNALNLIPFQINPHYFSGPTFFKRENGEFEQYGGETRDDRIREYHEMNDLPVLGIWEGGILRIENDRAWLTNLCGARLFMKGQPPRDLAPGSDVSELLKKEPERRARTRAKRR